MHRPSARFGGLFCLLAAALPAAAQAADDDVTLNGITIYGTIDLGVAYQTHGTPLSNVFGPGLEYLLQKNSNKALFSLAPNGMSQSNIGVRGSEQLAPGFAAIFNVQTQFMPTSGMVADHLKAMTENNGVPLAAQSSNADSSRAGQIFQNAYVGITSDTYGTLTLGRQNSLVLDNVLTYDPLGGSQAFALIGFSGVTAGGGDTEDSRLDSVVKYKLKVGPVRLGLLGQFNGQYGNTASAEQAGLGFDWQGLSIDGLYSFVKGAVAAAPLTTVPTGYSISNSLAGTISDNTAWSIMGKYRWGPVTAYGGYEDMRYANPESPLAVGAITIGGYVLATVNNTAYTINKILDVTWGGIKYSVTPDLDLTGAIYHYWQNSYSGNGCSDASNSKCSGTENSISLVADYTFNRHVDVYAGAMHTQVYNGLSNGFLNTSTIDPMIGMRVKF